jgi:hypothetical protein
MSSGKFDLRIVFDEDNDELIFHRMIPAGAEMKNGPLTRMPAVTIKISQLREKGPDEAERLLGASVFLFFEFHSNKKISIRNYEQESRDASHSIIERHEKRKKKEIDAATKFALALAYHDRAVDRRNASDIVAAERMLKEAASAGSGEAEQFLKAHWPRMKAAAERKIKEKQ